MSDVSKSPDRNTFQLKGVIKRAEKKGLDPNTDPETVELIELYQSFAKRDEDNINDPEWQKNNLEYDLRTTDWILEKVRNSEVYAQNLYAAMCNTDFTKNDVWPIIAGETWSCSWRSAGGIIANMRQEGDYIDWYLSGIRNYAEMDDDQFQALTSKQQERYLASKKFVAEGEVTDEVREDLLTLGWLVKEYNEGT